MKGQILGFDGTTGAINGEDGVRYSFAGDAWKGDRPPQSRDAVDFVVDGAAAQDIYPVASAMAAALGSLRVGIRQDGDATGGGVPALHGAFIDRIRDNPQIPVAALVIVNALVLPFVQGFAGLTPGAGAGSYTLVSLPGALAAASGQMKAAFGDASPIGAIFSAASGTPAAAGAGFGFAPMLAYLLWLIPALAAWLLYSSWKRGRRPVIELATGIACLGSLPILWLCNAGIRSALQSLPFGGMAAQAMMLHPAFGLFLMVACGIALIAIARGFIKRVPGL